MEYKIEELSPTKKKIQVDVPAEEVNASLAATTMLYQKDVEIKGFRKGKVPMSVISAKFRKKIFDEAATELINVHINEVLAAEKLTPLSRIEVENKELVQDEPFAYTFSFETAPKFDLPQYKGLKVNVEKAVVTDAEVAEVERKLMENMAKITPVEDVRPARDGEIAVITFGAYKDGEIFQGIKADNFEMEVGGGQALPEFEELVKTLAPGQSGEKEITFPADFINTDLAGKSVLMKATVHSVKERRMPPLDDETAKKGGFENVEKMREAIVKSYEHNRRQLAKSKAQKELLDRLCEGLSFPLPATLVEDRMDRMTHDYVHRLETRGKSVEGLGKTVAEIRDEQRPEAEKAVRAELLLLAVAEHEGLEVTPQEVEATLARLAAQSKQDPYTLRTYYEENNLIIPLKDRMLCDKAMERIFEEAEATEVDPVPAS